MAKHKRLLFLCTGNYYRSRFAEILFNSVAGKMGLSWKASSRGLAIERGVTTWRLRFRPAPWKLGLRVTDEFSRMPMAVTQETLNSQNGASRSSKRNISC